MGGGAFVGARGVRMNAQLGPATSNPVDVRRLELETTGPVEVAVRDVWGRDAFTRRSVVIPGPDGSLTRPARTGVGLRHGSGVGTDPAASPERV